MSNKLPEDFIDACKKYGESHDCKYFVGKIEDILNSVNDDDWFDLTRISKKLEKYREEQGKSSTNKYFVLNRDDYPQFKTAQQFYDGIEQKIKE